MLLSNLGIDQSMGMDKCRVFGIWRGPTGQPRTARRQGRARGEIITNTLAMCLCVLGRRQNVLFFFLSFLIASVAAEVCCIFSPLNSDFPPVQLFESASSSLTQGMRGHLYDNAYFDGDCSSVLHDDLFWPMSAFTSLDMVGYLKPPSDGEYTFTIHHKHFAELDINGCRAGFVRVSSEHATLCQPAETAHSVMVSLTRSRSYMLRIRVQVNFVMLSGAHSSCLFPSAPLQSGCESFQNYRVSVCDFPSPSPTWFFCTGACHLSCRSSSGAARSMWFRRRGSRRLL